MTKEEADTLKEGDIIICIAPNKLVSPVTLGKEYTLRESNFSHKELVFEDDKNYNNIRLCMVYESFGIKPKYIVNYKQFNNLLNNFYTNKIKICSK